MTDEEAQGIVNQAKRVASHMQSRMPWIDLSDAESAAVEGALQAHGRFTPGPEASFSTFSWHRMTGAILDQAESSRFIKKNGREKGMSVIQVSLSVMEEEETRADITGSDAYMDMVAALKSLTKREQHIVLMLAAGYKLVELATAWGISAMRVSQVAAEARLKISNSLGGL